MNRLLCLIILVGSYGLLIAEDLSQDKQITPKKMATSVTPSIPVAKLLKKKEVLNNQIKEIEAAYQQTIGALQIIDILIQETTASSDTLNQKPKL